MAKRVKQEWQSEFNDGPVEGIDTANKVFIEQPVLLTVGKPSYPSYSSSASNYSTGAHTNSPIRLESSRNYSVCPNPPDEIAYELSEKPTWKEIDEYLEVTKVMGFNRGAIVARRWCNSWRQMNPTEWGMIIQLMRHPINGGMKFNGPFMIKWFDFGGTPKEERGWAEDLVLIHAAMNDEVLKMVLEEQGVTVR